MKKAKRIFAFVGLALIALMYILTFVFAFMQDGRSQGFLHERNLLYHCRACHSVRHGNRRTESEKESGSASERIRILPAAGSFTERGKESDPPAPEE